MQFEESDTFCARRAHALAEELFACERGHMRAYHSLQSGEQLRYVTLGFVSDSAEKVEERLCGELRAVHGSFAGLDERPALYWRYLPRLEQGPRREWRVRTRLAIRDKHGMLPDWARFTTKPEGLPYPKV